MPWRAQQIIQIRQARSDKFTAIDQEIASRQAAAAPPMTEISARLQKAQKDGFKFHWRAARQEHEREKFRRVRFRDYLLKVAVGRN